MDKIEVSQRAREAATKYYGYANEKHLTKWDAPSCNRTVESLAEDFTRFERDILATRTDATPVAWMYHHEGDLEHGWQRLKFERRLQTYEGMTCNEEDAGVIETPLYTHPPATDVAAQDDTSLLERLADEACKRLGIDPNEIVDPVGPVRKKDDIIYAMYAFARDKFWDIEPNDVAALVEAAFREGWHDGMMAQGYGGTIESTDHDDWAASKSRQALAPFTKGQNDDAIC